jgi:hypothetical protein
MQRVIGLGVFAIVVLSVISGCAMTPDEGEQAPERIGALQQAETCAISETRPGQVGWFETGRGICVQSSGQAACPDGYGCLINEVVHCHKNPATKNGAQKMVGCQGPPPKLSVPGSSKGFHGLYSYDGPRHVFLPDGEGPVEGGGPYDLPFGDERGGRGTFDRGNVVDLCALGLSENCPW